MADEENISERPVGYVANPLKEVRERELRAAEEVEKGTNNNPDSTVNKAREDARLQREAEIKHREYLRDTRIKRNEEAARLEIGPTHPLHPRNAGNPSNPTSPVTHDPSIIVPMDNLGEGEP